MHRNVSALLFIASSARMKINIQVRWDLEQGWERIIGNFGLSISLKIGSLPWLCCCCSVNLKIRETADLSKNLHWLLHVEPLPSLFGKDCSVCRNNKHTLLQGQAKNGGIFYYSKLLHAPPYLVFLSHSSIELESSAGPPFFLPFFKRMWWL